MASGLGWLEGLEQDLESLHLWSPEVTQKDVLGQPEGCLGVGKVEGKGLSWQCPQLEVGIATEREGVRLGEGVEVESELDPVDIGVVEGRGPNGADGGGFVAAAGGLAEAEGQVDVEAGGRTAGAGAWKLGKYCIMC